jgi:hypothetical protein
MSKRIRPCSSGTLGCNEPVCSWAGAAAGQVRPWDGTEGIQSWKKKKAMLPGVPLESHCPLLAGWLQGRGLQELRRPQQLERPPPSGCASDDASVMVELANGV